MDSSVLFETYIPELGVPRMGKVRDIYEGSDRLILVATDRVSAFNQSFKEAIPDKGRILNAISRFWFEATQDIIPNHFISMPDPNVLLVKKCQPIAVEVIVRGYLTGSLWRDYSSGKRTKCGIELPDGLLENERLPAPIVTPTHKNTDDTEASFVDLVEAGVVTAANWNRMEEAALALFERGTTLLDKKGLTLVDTKYEFGLLNGELILIDELHTPDSSRFWKLGEKGVSLDKEFLRSWLLKNGRPEALTEKIVSQLSDNYRLLYKMILDQPLPALKSQPSKRLIENLVKEGLIFGFCVAVVGDVNLNLTGISVINISESVNDFSRFDRSLEPVVFVSDKKIGSRWPTIPLEAVEDGAEMIMEARS